MISFQVIWEARKLKPCYQDETMVYAYRIYKGLGEIGFVDSSHVIICIIMIDGKPIKT